MVPTLQVKRAKKCLDFAITCYFVHLVAVAAQSGFPTQGAWWVVVGTSVAATAVLGEWLCMRLELAEIPLNSVKSRRGGGGGSNGGSGLRTAGVAELTAVTVR